MGIYNEIKVQNYFDDNSGKHELKHIYNEINLTIKEQLYLAKQETMKLINLYEINGTYKDICIEENNLIDYAASMVMKVNAAIKDGKISEPWMKKLTEDLIFKGDKPAQVKLGLILSEKYLETEKLREVVETFSRSGDYIFYLIRSIKNLEKFNSYLFQLSKKTKGTIRVFAITNIELYDDEIINYLMEEGYKDNIYEDLLVEFLLSVVDVNNYLEKIKEDEEKINKFSYLLYRHLRNNGFSSSLIKNFMSKEYIQVAQTLGSDFYSLMAMLLVSQGLAEEEESGVNNCGKCLNIAVPLKKEKWKQVFLKELLGDKATTLDIIELANFYDYVLSIEELTVLLKKNNLDYYLYWYVNNKESEDKRIAFLRYFYQAVDIDKLITKSGEKEAEPYEDSGLLEDILITMIKGCRRIYPEGKDLALKVLSAKSLEIRSEAIKCLTNHMDKLSKTEIALINSASELEENYQLRIMLNKLTYKEKNCKVEFINKKELNNAKISRHVKDVYMMSTYVAGYKYRDQEILSQELKKSRIYYLRSEIDNVYDEKAIKIVGESGYVIGYIPRKDNEILSNLIVKNIYLYCTVREYSLEEEHISIDIYLSYKNVLDEANQLWKVLTEKNNGAYKN